MSLLLWPWAQNISNMTAWMDIKMDAMFRWGCRVKNDSGDIVMMSHNLTCSSYLQATSARPLISPNRLRSSSLGPASRKTQNNHQMAHIAGTAAVKRVTDSGDSHQLTHFLREVACVSVLLKCSSVRKPCERMKGMSLEFLDQVFCDSYIFVVSIS